MSETTVSTAPETGAETTTPTTEATAPAAESTQDTTDWKAEAEKWKALSRKNEQAAKSASSEVEKAKAASMSDAEKAVAEAEKRGRTAAMADVGRQLAAAKFEAAAASAGVTLGEAADLIDMSRFVDAKTGDIDTDAIKAAVKQLAKLAPKPAAGRSGGEFAGGTGAGTPITDEQLARMSPAEINKAYEAGQLTHLM